MAPKGKLFPQKFGDCGSTNEMARLTKISVQDFVSETFTLDLYPPNETIFFSVYQQTKSNVFPNKCQCYTNVSTRFPTVRDGQFCVRYGYLSDGHFSACSKICADPRFSQNDTLPSINTILISSQCTIKKFAFQIWICQCRRNNVKLPLVDPGFPRGETPTPKGSSGSGGGSRGRCPHLCPK